MKAVRVMQVFDDGSVDFAKVRFDRFLSEEGAGYMMEQVGLWDHYHFFLAVVELHPLNEREDADVST